MIIRTGGIRKRSRDNDRSTAAPFDNEQMRDRSVGGGTARTHREKSREELLGTSLTELANLYPTFAPAPSVSSEGVSSRSARPFPGREARPRKCFLREMTTSLRKFRPGGTSPFVPRERLSTPESTKAGDKVTRGRFMRE